MEEERFGEKLSHILKDKGISNTSLARTCGLSRECISLYISGKREPKEKTMYRICDGLDMSMADFYANDCDQVRDEREAELLRNYRRMSEYRKGLVIGYICRIMEEEGN